MSCCPHCETPCAPSDILSANGLKWLRCSSCLELTDCSALEELAVVAPPNGQHDPHPPIANDVDDDALTLVFNPIRQMVRVQASDELVLVREVERPSILKAAVRRFWPRALLPAAPSARFLLPAASTATEAVATVDADASVASAPRTPRSRRVTIPPLPVAARFPSQPRVSVMPPPRPVRAAASAAVDMPSLPPPPRPTRPARRRRLPGDSSRPRDAMLPDSLFLVPSLARFFAPSDRRPPPSPVIRSSEIQPLKIAVASGLALIAVVSMLALGKQAMGYLSAHGGRFEPRSSVNAAVTPVVGAPRIRE